MKHFAILAALVLALCLCLLPQCAWAAEALGQIDLQTAADQSGEGWTWDAANKTLALNNCDLTFRADGFRLPAGTVVTVDGNCSIVVGANHTSGSALIVETGSLTVKSAGGGVQVP